VDSINAVCGASPQMGVLGQLFFIDSIRVQYYLRLSHKKTKEQNK